MGIKNFLPTRNFFMIISFVLGLTGSILYATQLIWNWFGSDHVDKTIFSFICLILLLFACGTAYVGQRYKRLKNPWKTALKISFFMFIAVSVLICVLGGFAMTMDVNTETYFNNEFGFLTGFRMLTSVTQSDINSLQNWALGVAQIIKALFLIVPFLIGAWGGLSVLTADSIDEAEGGILAIVAAIVVVIVVWLFKLVEVTLG